MKILINTITPTETQAIRDQQEKDGIEEKNLFSGTYEIGGERLIPGEWLHVTDKWVTDNAVDLAKAPYVKEAYIVLQERVKQALEEQGLNAFAQGLVEAAEVYSTATPAVATDVHKYAPYVGVKEVG